MIEFKNLSQEIPYKILKEKYDTAIDVGQDSVDAICIASYSKKTNEVNARYVNLKIIDNNEFIFFTNYESLKAKDFIDHDQITALLYWNKTNTQIRLKAKIKKTQIQFNKKYFQTRDLNKNALSISSNQSSKIESYDLVKKKYLDAFYNKDLKKCPKYWGGFSFTPYYFEFWEGHDSRINKREAFILNNDKWSSFTLEP